MMSRILLITIVLFNLLHAFSSAYAQILEVKVNITNMRSQKGKILLSVFKDSKSFDDEKPYKNFVFDKNHLTSGSLTVICSLEQGTYGFTLVDDENNSNELDKNMIGMPKEGFGFSNFFLEKLQKPSFDEFKFDLKSNRTIIIKIKYL
ncbi:MAG: DUF2141 domain-containing protein [Opitutaceae bacterium]|nr:DUF2141 domain-containing protein [Cytophagales bacterium]